MATTKTTKKTAKKPAKKAGGKAGRTEDLMLQAVQALRENPKKYSALQKALNNSKSDKDRVKQLIKYATSDRELAALLPAKVAQGGETQLMWTTVTVTTIFILEGSAY